MKVLARVRGPRRQVQAAGRPRAAAVGERHRLRRARAGRPTSRPNRDVGLQLSGDISTAASVAYAGRRLQRRARPRQRRRRRERRQGLRGARLPPAVQDAARSTGLGVGVAGEHRHRARHHRRRRSSRATARRASRPCSATSAARTTPANNVFANGSAPAPRAAGLLLHRPLGLHGEYILSWQEVSRATSTRSSSSTRRGRPPARSSSPARRTRGSAAPRPRSRSIPRPAPSAPSSSPRATASSRIDDATFPAYANPASTPSKAKALGGRRELVLWPRRSRSSSTTSTPRSTAAPPRGDREPENFVVTRVQHSF